VDARRDDTGDQMLEYRRGYHGAVSAAQRRRISLTVYGISPQSLSRMVTAFATTSTLSKGTDSLTAVFTPTKPTGFGPSTSPPVSQTVNTLPGVTNRCTRSNGGNLRTSAANTARSAQSRRGLRSVRRSTATS
jgi:hypothetical protein